MVKKIKVVDVATEEVKPDEETKPIEEVKDIEDVKQVEEDKPVEEVKPVEIVVEAIKDVKEEIKPKKQPEYVNCENCNKKVLMKTYKYSHLNVCKGKRNPPEPPQAPAPPPTPSPEKPKRASKQKEEPIIQEKPEFHGVVSFSNPDPYTILRQERALIRQQRVKSLISQAI